jgi:hypothetical protein
LSFDAEASRGKDLRFNFRDPAAANYDTVDGEPPVEYDQWTTRRPTLVTFDGEWDGRRWDEFENLIVVTSAGKLLRIDLEDLVDDLDFTLAESGFDPLLPHNDNAINELVIRGINDPYGFDAAVREHDLRYFEEYEFGLDHAEFEAVMRDLVEVIRVIIADLLPTAPPAELVLIDNPEPELVQLVFNPPTRPDTVEPVTPTPPTGGGGGDGDGDSDGDGDGDVPTVTPPDATPVPPADDTFVDINDMDVPLAAFPNENDAFIEIDDLSVPLASYADTNEALTEISDTRVPLGAMPQTGIESMHSVFVTGLMLSAFTAAVIAGNIRKLKAAKEQS